MSTRLAAQLHTGDVFMIGDWAMHATGNAHLDALHRIEINVSEFGFPVHLEWYQLVTVVDG